MKYKISKKEVKVKFQRRLCDFSDKACEYSQSAYRNCSLPIGEKEFNEWRKINETEYFVEAIDISVPEIKKYKKVKLGVITVNTCPYRNEMDFRILDKKNAPHFLNLEEHYETNYNIFEFR